jgi:hypothetical protein
MANFHLWFLPLANYTLPEPSHNEPSNFPLILSRDLVKVDGIYIVNWKC